MRSSPFTFTASSKNGGHPINEGPTVTGSDGIQSARRWLEISPVVRGVAPLNEAPTPQYSTNVAIGFSSLSFHITRDAPVNAFWGGGTSVGRLYSVQLEDSWKDLRFRVPCGIARAKA